MNAPAHFQLPAAEASVAVTLLLVVPPQRGLLEGFVSGLTAIANYVTNEAPDVDVRLLDLGLASVAEMEREVAAVLSEAPGRVFVGITGTTASYQRMLRTAEIFKRADPSVIVVMGGPHVSAQDDVVMRFHSDVVDYVVRGEGERAMVDLIRHHPDALAVHNVTFIGESGEVVRNPEGPLMLQPDLDRLAPTLKLGRRSRRPVRGRGSLPGKFDRVTYVSARGCPLACSFCVVRASPIRAKSVPAIIEDIRHLVEDLGYTALAIEDNFFAHQPKRTIELCEAIAALRTELHFDWDCQTRVESMRRPDIANSMARAGCSAAYLGVESLVPAQLRFLGKTPRPDTYLEVLENEVVPVMLNAGIDIYINLQLGLPLETSEERIETLRRLRRLGTAAAAKGRVITVFPQLAVIYPGTPHFAAAIAKGQFGPLGADVFEEFTLWEEREEPILKYLGEHFAHGIGGIPQGLLQKKALLRGQFALSADRLADISTQMRELDSVKGVTVFKYGRYLTPDSKEGRRG